MSQTSYSMNMRVGTTGQIGDGYDYDALTYNNPSDEISYGRALAKISGNDTGCKLPDASDADIVGVAIRDVASENDKYTVNSAVSSMRRGRIFVEVEESVTPDDPVYVRFDGKSQVQTLTFNNNFVADNIINLNIDDVAITPVPFNTDHDTTMANLAAAIQTSDSVGSATTPGGGSQVITITGVSHGTDITIDNVLVTGGASQPVGSVAETVDAISDSSKGLFRKDDDGAAGPAATALLFSTARYLTSADSGDVALLDLNLV